MSFSRSSTSNTSESGDTIKKGQDKIIQLYDILPTYCVKEDTADILESLRETMKSYIVIGSKYQDLKTASQKVTQQITKHLVDGTQETFDTDEIHQLLKNAMSSEGEKHRENFWEKDKMYTALKDLEAEEESENMNEDEGDEELAITRATVQTIDPYSKKEFVDPMKNQRCGHSYEREIVLNLIASNPRLKCYRMGCNNKNPIKADDLVPDDELRRHISRMKARAAL